MQLSKIASLGTQKLPPEREQGWEVCRQNMVAGFPQVEDGDAERPPFDFDASSVIRHCACGSTDRHRLPAIERLPALLAAVKRALAAVRRAGSRGLI